MGGVILFIQWGEEKVAANPVRYMFQCLGTLLLSHVYVAPVPPVGWGWRGAVAGFQCSESLKWLTPQLGACLIGCLIGCPAAQTAADKAVGLLPLAFLGKSRDLES